MRMQKRNGKTQELVYKPYLRGSIHGADALKKSVRIFFHYVIFMFVYIVMSTVLNFDSRALTWIVNLVVVLLCASILYADGAREGESQVALGEIAYGKKEAGKEVKPREQARCYHPLKCVVSALLGMLPFLIVTMIYACIAKKQVYELQTLPEWVTAFGAESEVMRPLKYYTQWAGLGFADVLRILETLLIFPFKQIARSYGNDAVLLVDRLSPLLLCVPALGYMLGYWTGPRSRAMVHADIKKSNTRFLRRKQKAARAAAQRTEKKNELI